MNEMNEKCSLQITVVRLAEGNCGFRENHTQGIKKNLGYLKYLVQVGDAVR